MQELLEEDKAYWMVTYTDGTTFSEGPSQAYTQIDRTRIKEFHVMRGAVPAVSVSLPTGQDWRGFMFRRRTSLNSGYGRSVIMIFGWMNGPAWSLSLEQKAYGILENGFVENDPVFYPPAPYEGIEIV